MLLATVSASAKHKLAFDPYSVVKVTYRAKDCKQNQYETLCKKAYFTFGAIASHPIAPGETFKSSFVAPKQEKKDGSVITYQPWKCTELPKGEYECRDVSWRKKETK